MSTKLKLESFMTVRTDIQLNLVIMNSDESNTWITQNKNFVHVQYLSAEFSPEN